VTATPDVPVTPRADLVERALSFLPAGSEIHQAFIGQAAPNFRYFIVTYLTSIMSRNTYRETSGAGRADARHTRLGPVSGRWTQVELLGERHWVHERFYDQIAAADREAGF
jgi:hypothetical protein